jgi:hypothetical protein
MMSQFTVFLYDSAAGMESWARMSAAEMQAAIEQYMAWSDRLAAGGKLVSGEKLRDGEGRVLRGTGAAQRVTDGPFTEAREVIGGLYVIEAADYDEVVRLVADCPHLHFGGTVEIRAIETVGAPQEPEAVAAG